MDWAAATAPSLGEFEHLARQAYERLPEAFRKLTGGIVIRIDEFATDEVLDELGIASEYDLMGLYQGVSLDRASHADLPRGPDMIFLYRRAILDYWAEDEIGLGALITHVLVHEIGHHFGLSDADMERIEASADAE